MRPTAFVLALVAGSSGAMLDNGQDAPRKAVPLDPVTAVVDAFSSHPIVAFPGKPVTREITALILKIIRDPRFPAAVSDIVVEFGNARYQDLVDRYVRGDNVTEADLQKVWQDTTEPVGTFDGPLTVEVFRAVREINRGLADPRRLRMLLGDPPIDWDQITSKGDLRKWVVRRDSHASDVVRREVLDRGRKALLLYGHLHYPRKEIMTNYDMTDWQALRMEDQADAVMKLPAKATNVLPLPALCGQPGYVAMRVARTTIAGLPGEAARIKKTCGGSSRPF